MEIETIKQKDDTGNNDLGDLQKYCNAKIKIIGVYDNGSQIANGPERENAFTYDPSIIRNLMLGKDPRTNRQKINRFYFRPSCCGLIKIDMGHGVLYCPNKRQIVSLSLSNYFYAIY
jgi:hypothetical protein